MCPSKEENDLTTLDDNDHLFSVVELEYDGSPMILRINQTAQDWMKHPSLSIRVGFAIPLNQPNPDLYPFPEENEQLNEIEDHLRSLVKSNTPCIHGFSITTGRFKEVVFYIKDGDVVEKIHKLSMEEIKTHEIQCTAEYDPEWAGYLSMAEI